MESPKLRPASIVGGLLNHYFHTRALFRESDEEYRVLAPFLCVGARRQPCPAGLGGRGRFRAGQYVVGFSRRTSNWPSTRQASHRLPHLPLTSKVPRMCAAFDSFTSSVPLSE